ncbi:MAG: hypothetical protein A2330_09690 [Ignavibacteria bacterium RIFOXYB2_FULL_36_7]|nr:MAG: hypothetical protein A2330_09690 [Ignavibacteria bacterium RIFOXYB2_FULL_36_7]
MSHVFFHRLAKEEFFQTRDFYDELIFGLCKTFVIEIERCLNIIKTNPLAFPIIKENIRKAVVIKFPYSILYRIEKGNVYILAVMHQKRKPQYWSHRI